MKIRVYKFEEGTSLHPTLGGNDLPPMFSDKTAHITHECVGVVQCREMTPFLMCYMRRRNAITPNDRHIKCNPSEKKIIAKMGPSLYFYIQRYLHTLQSMNEAMIYNREIYPLITHGGSTQRVLTLFHTAFARDKH